MKPENVYWTEYLPPLQYNTMSIHTNDSVLERGDNLSNHTLDQINDVFQKLKYATPRQEIDVWHEFYNTYKRYTHKDKKLFLYNMQRLAKLKLDVSLSLLP